MSKVFTANVFITKSKAAMHQLFFGKHQVTSFKQRLDYLSNEDLDASFLASPFNNDGLLRFEYSMNEGDGESVQSRILLSLVESSKLLEFVLLDNDPMARKLAHALETRMWNRESPQVIEYLDYRTGDTLAVLAAQDHIPPAEQSEKLDEDNDFSYLKKEKLPKKKDPNESIEKKFARVRMSNTYYFAFGVGDNLDTWDGPHSMVLAGATLSNSEGNVRMVDVTFVPNIDTLRALTGKFEEEMGYGGAVKKFNQALTARSFQRTWASETLNAWDINEMAGGLEGYITPQSTFAIRRTNTNTEYYQTDLNYSMRSLIAKYIGSVTKRMGNAVVVIPENLRGLSISRPQASPITFSITPESKKLLARYGIRAILPETREFKAKGKIAAWWKAKRENERVGDANKYMEKLMRGHEEKQEAEIEHLRLQAAGAAIDLAKNPAYLSNQDPEEQDKEHRIRKQWRWFLRKAMDIKTANPPSPGETIILAEELNRISYDFDADERGKGVVYNEILKGILDPLGFWDGEVNRILVGEGAPSTQELTTARLDAHDKLVDRRPEGVPVDGQAKMTASEAARQEEAATKNLESLNAQIHAKESALASFDITTEQVDLAALDPFPVSDLDLKLVMEVTNPTSQSGATQAHTGGFSPLLSPLTKFANGLDRKDSTPYDFFEETDVRLLRLWKQYGIITDDSKSAFVFGDIKAIKDFLYLDGYAKNPEDYKVGKSDRVGFHGEIRYGAFAPIAGEVKRSINSWMSATYRTKISQGDALTANENDMFSYSRYLEDFIDEFLTHTSSRVSSFEVTEDVDETNLSTKLKTKDEGVLKFDGFKNVDIILKHNMENSNVTDLSFTMKNYITSLMNMSVRPELDHQLIGTSRRAANQELIKTLLDNEFLNDMAMVTENKSDSLAGRAEVLLDVNKRDSLILGIAQQMEKYPELKGQSSFDILSMFLVLKGFEGGSEIREYGDDLISPSQRQADITASMMDRYARQLYEIDVKTLPFFNHKLNLDKTVGLIGMTGGIVGQKYDSRHLAPYTGEFRITGWRHVISVDDISTFMKLKRSGLDSKNELTSRSALVWVKSEIEDRIARLESESITVAGLIRGVRRIKPLSMGPSGIKLYGKYINDTIELLKSILEKME